MKFIITKIILLSFIFMTAACSDEAASENDNKKEQEQAEKKAPLSQFKAIPLPDKSSFKNPTF